MPLCLRLIEVYDPQKNDTVAFLTNQLDWVAAAIGALYKDRWQIETSLKALKQNLNIRTFVGTSPSR